jgi:thioredoxin-related protein
MEASAMSILKSSVVALIFSTLSALTFAADAYPDTDAAVDLKNAVSNVQDGQLIMMTFGANWCYNCRNLATALKSDSLEPWVDENFELVKVNISNPGQNSATVQAFGNPAQNGMPAIVFADAEGNLLTKLPSSQVIRAVRGGNEAVKALLADAQAEALAKL